MAYVVRCAEHGDVSSHPTKNEAERGHFTHEQSHRREAIRAWLQTLPTEGLQPSERLRILRWFASEFGVRL